jgi:hypothetical protein
MASLSAVRALLALASSAVVLALAAAPAGAAGLVDPLLPASGWHGERGEPVSFEVRAPVGAQVVVVVTTMRLTDTAGRLYSLGAFAGTLAPSLQDPARYAGTAPASTPLGRRPGRFFWQAQVLPHGGDVTYGPIRSLRLGPPASATRRGPIPRSIGRRGGTRFAFSSYLIPPSAGGRAGFRRLAAASARRWGLRPGGWTRRQAGRRDGRNVVGFGEIRASALGVQVDYMRGRRVVEQDLVLQLGLPWEARDYPDDSHFDLESVLIHEFGHMAGNHGHRPRCQNSPLIVALARGEWWHSPEDQFQKGCGAAAWRAEGGARDEPRLPILHRRIQVG